MNINLTVGFTKNPRTTWMGIAALLSVAADVIRQVVTGHFDFNAIGADASAIFLAIGMFLAADAKPDVADKPK